MKKITLVLKDRDIELNMNEDQHKQLVDQLVNEFLKELYIASLDQSLWVKRDAIIYISSENEDEPE